MCETLCVCVCVCVCACVRVCLCVCVCASLSTSNEAYLLQKQRLCRLIADKYNVVTCESVARRSYFTNNFPCCLCSAQSLISVCEPEAIH